MTRGYRHTVLGLMVLGVLVGVFWVALVSADTTATIDFEAGLNEGDFVSSLDCTTPLGINCSGAIDGAISVVGVIPSFAGNRAMIFDAECLPGGTSGGCTGGDPDLFFPGQGNILIVSEDQDPSDPDDADAMGSRFEFDFSGFGPGAVTVKNIVVGDIELEEGGAFLEAFEGGCAGTSLGVTPFPQTGDGNIATVAVGISGVDCLRVVLNGSGAIDNLEVSIPEELPAFARITGGGWRITGSNGESVRSSQGLTLHCDILLSNNLQVNWDRGQKWHIDKFVDAAFCEDNPNFTPEPPVAPADTYIGVDVGKLNNFDTATACFIFEDHGEVSGDPDGPDRALIRIWAPGTAPAIADFDLAGNDPCKIVSDPPDGDTVLFVPLSDISGGNLQFHFDQPHKGN